MKYRTTTYILIPVNSSNDDPRILRGMEKQFRLRKARLDAGEKQIGWKVGFGAPAALERLQITTPLIGFLTDKVLLTSGATIFISGWTKPAIEPEIAVRLGNDLSGKVDRDTAQAAILSIGPAIEVADVNFAPEDVEKILAGNIYNRHIILGHTDAEQAGCRLENLEALVSLDTREIARTSDLQAQTGDFIDITVHLADLLSRFGERLQAGEVIIMGSIVPPIWMEASGEYEYALKPIDTISVNIKI